jgi:hypothetical protein
VQPARPLPARCPLPTGPPSSCSCAPPPSQPPPAPFPPAARLYRYDSPTYNASYLYNGQGLPQERAEQACRDNGGHLVAWQSQAEQNAVEQYFMALMILNVPYVQSYWLGLATNTSRVWG